MSYPSWYDNGYVGMAYDFTHNNNMHTDGYQSPDTGSYVFLGFIWYSPEYKTLTGYGSNDYGSFVTIFYQYLLQYHYSVNSALNAASILTLGKSSFGIAPLHTGIQETSDMGTYWSYMYVYGNGNLGIPA